MLKSNSAVSDPTSIRGRSSFCRQIHRPGRSDQTPSSFGKIHCPGRSDRAPSSFGEVVLSSAIQLLSGDDQAFVVRSTPGRSDRAPSSFGEVILPSTIQLLSGDDWAFATIGLLPSNPPPGRSDRAPSSFGEVEAKLYHRRLLGEAMVELHRCCPLKATTY
ncbi:hypothetical protein E6C27_scaffold114G001270 [Cucumis melo var. makuwa]|uniref:Uncharacterized protein n=1 Tax=Cucumis melo var. makuwa TaxID=1194695 RepID=A0A5A7TUR4_CUCMM|nr:hypothetical protein E6C27_scaffold114G001270 [Cucumis melo var. makuwa]